MPKDRQISGFCQRAEKAVEHEGDNDTDCSCCPWNGPKSSGKETEKTGDQRKSRNSIVKIGQNIKKSLGDFRRLTVTQTPVKNYQLTLV